VNQKLDCQWRYICSFKFAYTGVAERVWILPALALEARIDLTHVSDSGSEVDTGLPSSTALPRLENLSNMRRTRGRR